MVKLQFGSNATVEGEKLLTTDEFCVFAVSDSYKGIALAIKVDDKVYVIDGPDDMMTKRFRLAIINLIPKELNGLNDLADEMAKDPEFDEDNEDFDIDIFYEKYEDIIYDYFMDLVDNKRAKRKKETGEDDDHKEN